MFRRGVLRPRGLLCVLVVCLGLLVANPAEAEWDSGRVIIGPANGDALHVMSFNLRYASPTGPNSWPRRRPALAELLRTEQPTVIGTQEGLYQQLRDIDHDLPDHYTWIGLGRAGGSRDEFTAVFYDTRRLTPLAYDHFWLSETPDVIASRSWDSGSLRMATWVHFADRRTGAELVVLNTHLDNHSDAARRHGAELIRDRLNTFTVPVILTGDFNVPATPSSAPYRILTEGAHLTDTWTAALDHRTPQYRTWHNYRPLASSGNRIDWILTRGIPSVPAVAINPSAPGGQFPSDHLPVQALITLR